MIMPHGCVRLKSQLRCCARSEARSVQAKHPTPMPIGAVKPPAKRASRSSGRSVNIDCRCAVILATFPWPRFGMQEPVHDQGPTMGSSTTTKTGRIFRSETSLRELPRSNQAKPGRSLDARTGNRVKSKPTTRWHSYWTTQVELFAPGTRPLPAQLLATFVMR